MTDIAQPTSARSLPLTTAPAWLMRWWRGILVGVCVLLATGYSLYRLAAFGGADPLAALLAFIPAIAAVLFVRLGTRPKDPHANKRDLFADGVFALPVFMVALFLLLVLPTQQSWYYWLSRVDLLAVPVMTAATIIVFWGMPNLGRTWPAMAYLCFVWPVPLLLLQQRLNPVLVQLTTAATGPVSRLLGLPVTVPAERRVFEITTATGSLVVSAGDLTAPFTAVAGFLLLAVPLALCLEGSWVRRGIWLAAGTVLAFAANLVRTLLLIFAISQPALIDSVDLLRPGLALALAALVLVVALLALPLFGLRVRALPAGSLLPWQHDKVKLPPGLVITILVFSLLMGILNLDLLRFGSLSQSTLPTVRASTPAAVLPPLDDWQVTSAGPIDWRSIFGINSRAELFEYTYTGGGTPVRIGVQVALSDDRRLVDSYPLENSRLFHLDEVVAVRDVDLGHGLTGRLVETLPDDGAPTSILYFLVPVLVGDTAYNARVALFFDEFDRYPRDLFPAQPLSLATELQTGLNSSLGRFGNANPDARFEPMAEFAVGFGRQLVDRIVELRS